MKRTEIFNQLMLAVPIALLLTETIGYASGQIEFNFRLSKIRSECTEAADQHLPMAATMKRLHYLPYRELGDKLEGEEQFMQINSGLIFQKMVRVRARIRFAKGLAATSEVIILDP